MLTGGLRTPSQFSQVIRQNHANLLGIGRLSILCPNLPLRVSPSTVSHDYDDTNFPLPEPTLFTPHWFPKLIGGGLNTAWYVVGMRELANGREVDIEMGGMGALFWMWAWSGPGGLVGVVKWVPSLLLITMISIILVEWI